MQTKFLPSILVPIFGLIFPGFSMALFFIYISINDVDWMEDRSYEDDADWMEEENHKDDADWMEEENHKDEWTVTISFIDKDFSEWTFTFTFTDDDFSE